VKQHHLDETYGSGRSGHSWESAVGSKAGLHERWSPIPEKCGLVVQPHRNVLKIPSRCTNQPYYDLLFLTCGCSGREAGRVNCTTGPDPKMFFSETPLCFCESFPTSDFPDGPNPTPLQEHIDCERIKHAHKLVRMHRTLTPLADLTADEFLMVKTASIHR
jgi:hypothetical protein